MKNETIKKAKINKSGLYGLLLHLGRLTRIAVLGSGKSITGVLSLLINGNKKQKNDLKDYGSEDEENYIFWATGLVSFLITCYQFFIQPIEINYEFIPIFFAGWALIGFFTFLGLALIGAISEFLE